jgi:hypothetical protein
MTHVPPSSDIPGTILLSNHVWSRRRKSRLDCRTGFPSQMLRQQLFYIFPPAAFVRAFRIASGLFMMFMKLCFPIMDRSGKLTAMRNRA